MPIKRTHKPNRKTRKAIKSDPIKVEWPDISTLVEQLNDERVHDEQVKENSIKKTTSDLVDWKHKYRFVFYSWIGILLLFALSVIVNMLFPRLLF